MKAVLSVAAFTLAAAAPVEAQRASAPSLAGTWAFTEPHGRNALQSDACGNDSGVRYAPSGTWHDLMPGEEGRWSLRGLVLTERVTHRHGSVGRQRVHERAGSARLRWFSPDHVNIEKGRDKLGLLRCSPPSRFR